MGLRRIVTVKEEEEKKICFRPGSNRGPCACEAHVITATLRKLRNTTRSFHTSLTIKHACVAATPLAAGQTVRGSNPCAVEVFRTHPDLPRGLFLGGKVAKVRR